MHLDVTTLASLGANNLWVRFSEPKVRTTYGVRFSEPKVRTTYGVRFGEPKVRTTYGVRFSEPKVVVKLVGVGLHNFGF